jgi:hypothetical protein
MHREMPLVLLVLFATARACFDVTSGYAATRSYAPLDGVIDIDEWDAVAFKFQDGTYTVVSTTRYIWPSNVVYAYVYTVSGSTVTSTYAAATQCVSGDYVVGSCDATQGVFFRRDENNQPLRSMGCIGTCSVSVIARDFACT